MGASDEDLATRPGTTHLSSAGNRCRVESYDAHSPLTPRTRVK